MKRSMLISVLFAFCAFAGSEKSEPIKELLFGIISTESNSSLKKGFDPFLMEFEKKIQMPVKAFFATDYSGVIEAMRFNKIQLAWMGNKAAMEAIDRADAEVILQTSAADGNRGYNSLIITNTESPFTSIEDIVAAGSRLSFGNGDPNSTSGYLIPQCYIWSKRNIDPQKFFKNVRNANHEANCMAVVSKQVDFATNNTEFLAKFRTSQPEKAANIRVIWKSPEIPNDPIVCRKDLPYEVKNKIKAALLSFGRIGPDVEKERGLLKNLSTGWGLFYDSDNMQLLTIRELDLLSQKDKNAAAQLNEKEKSGKNTDIEEKLEKIKNYRTLDTYWNSKKY